MEQKITAGIDELTVVLSVDTPLLKGLTDWKEKAESTIKEFVRRTGLEDIFGKQKESADRPPQGYTTAYRTAITRFTLR